MGEFPKGLTFGDVHVIKTMAGHVPDKTIAFALKIPVKVVKEVRKRYKV